MRYGHSLRTSPVSTAGECTTSMAIPSCYRTAIRLSLASGDPAALGGGVSRHRARPDRARPYARRTRGQSRRARPQARSSAANRRLPRLGRTNGACHDALQAGSHTRSGGHEHMGLAAASGRIPHPRFSLAQHARVARWPLPAWPRRWPAGASTFRSSTGKGFGRTWVWPRWIRIAR